MKYLNKTSAPVSSSDKSAASRTLPMFAGEPGPKEKRPTIRTLRMRLWKAALRWYLDECGYEEVLSAARELHVSQQSL